MSSKYDKYYNFSSSLVCGIIFIIIGIILCIGKEKLYKDIISILVMILLLISLFNLAKFLSKNRNFKDNISALVSCIFNLVISFVFIFSPNLPLGLLPFLFSLYLILIAISNLVMYILLFRNKSNHKIRYIIAFIIYFSISVPILFSPVKKIDTFIVCLSLYIILLGISYVWDFVVNITSVKTKNKIKRHIRITLPKIFEAIIPYSVMIEINRNLEVDKKYSYFKNSDEEAELYVFIHTSNRGFNKFGHIDVYFDGNVFSYGNYDEGSRNFKQMFGDGVMFVTPNRKEYINFCIDNSEKTLFEFGIRLNSEQKNIIKKRINDIMFNAVNWDYKLDEKYNDGSSYTAKLHKKTKANFYKFKSGKYKTYFVLGCNCCYLADDIIGKGGGDLLSLNGIITPGTYYDYLNRQLHKKNSIVISKNIYNNTRRCK